MSITTEHIKNFFSVMDQVATERGRNAKIDLIKRLTGAERIFAKWWWRHTLDPFIMFGISPPTDITFIAGRVPSFEELENVVRTLCMRVVTGNRARDLARFLLSCDQQVSFWLARMFYKDPKCGLSYGSISKIWPGLVRTFDIPKGDKLYDPKQLGDGCEWISEPKMDGLRGLIIPVDGQVKCLSSGGHELFNVEPILEALKDYAGRFVFDGEFVVDNNWGATQSFLMSSSREVTDEQREKLRFHIFDLHLHEQEWIPGQGFRSWSQRHAEREAILEEINCPYLVSVGFEFVEGFDHAWELAQHYVDQGFEGGMIKRTDSVMKRTRNDQMLKLKFEKTMDVTVIGAVLSNDHELLSKYGDAVLGSFQVRDKDGNEFSCGGGFSDIQRVEFWEKREQFIGKKIEIKAQKDPGTGIVCRFPVFKRPRFDL